MSLAIAAFRTRLGLTQLDLATLTGLSKNAISNYELGKNGVGPRNITRLAEALKVTPFDLMNYQPMAYQTQQNQETASQVQKVAEPAPASTARPLGASVPQLYANLRFVPIPARATFAEMGDAPDPELFDTIAVPIQPHEDPSRLEKCWVFEVNGDSMEPTLNHGQRIVAEPINEGDWEYQSDRVYVISYAGYLVVKRIKTNDLRQRHYLELWSDNEKKGGMKVAQRGEIKGIWKVLRLDRAPEIY